MIALFLSVWAGAASADVVTAWNDHLLAVTTAASVNRPNPEIGAASAYIHIAMYHAISSIDGNYILFTTHVIDAPVQDRQQEGQPPEAPEVIENRLAEWRRLLRSSTTQGRTVLQRILRGRLTFTPRLHVVTGEPDGYEFEGPTRFDRLFTGIAVERPKGVDTGYLGSEYIGPEDTLDGDYGRLLDRAAKKHGKVEASPTGFEPVFWP